MRTPMTAVLSCCASVLATCSAVYLLWAASAQDIPIVLSLGVVLPAAALIGFAAWAGSESGALFARRRQATVAARSGTLLSVAALLVVGALLGGIFGMSLSLRAQSLVSFWLLVAAMATVSLRSGLISTLRSRPIVAPSIAAIACCIVGGVGVGLSLGFGLQFAASYRPCPLHAFCLDPGPWYGVQSGLPSGTIVGLAVGLLVWPVLGLDCAISSQSRRPPSTASA